ncbi:hypothetical protein [Paenibacillus polymyxa]|uniref:hypothetical protein n=1 Tax=Paenibacillus polymyxa TaxID=1406 RepID=UPI002377D717|nr:hypothetical protein [Paenibacillus polymyxa]WDM24217.1 hypothetical protein J4I02_12485 [Paenibacillus polymyxa]
MSITVCGKIFCCRFSIRDWLVKPLTVAVSTPNANWNEDEYHKGVILPIRRLEELLKSIESGKSSSAYEPKTRSAGVYSSDIANQTSKK